ncbi:MAG: lipopolysaccharide biosynthesis protein [Rubrivivax sp.]|nr:lipopolysaccharide biosynthesis protein [Rubrivivax sp.]
MSAAAGTDDTVAPLDGEDARGVAPIDVLVAVAGRWRTLIVAPLSAGLIALGGTYLIDPLYTARTSILAPASQGSAAASALAALGNLGALAGGAVTARTPADQLVALLESETIAERMLDHFDLVKLYRSDLRLEARRVLRARSRIAAGRKDGLIAIEVEDTDPQRAAEMANRYVEELRRLSATLAVTEAQQRRAFFETHLEKTRDELARAQRALQASGFDSGALRAEPRAAAEQYARIKADTTAAEVRLQILTTRLTDNAPEVQQARSALLALRDKLSELERADDASRGADYVGRFRDFKYQETLYEMFARQYELARVDESREGVLIQVVDPAVAPEWKSSPKRALIATVATIVSTALLLVAVALHCWFQLARDADPRATAGLQRIWQAIRRR